MASVFNKKFDTSYILRQVIKHISLEIQREMWGGPKRVVLFPRHTAGFYKWEFYPNDVMKANEKKPLCLAVQQVSDAADN